MGLADDMAILEDVKPTRRKAAAFFDFDGTLVSGHMIADFPEYLAGCSIFPRGVADEVDRHMNDLRAGKVTYRFIAENLPAVYASGARGRTSSDLEKASVGFVDWRMDSVFPYAKPLIDAVHKAGYLAIGLSGSPVEPVRELGKRLGLDVSFGTILTTREGAFTGKVARNLIMHETKKLFFREICFRLRLEKKECFGFGDTEQDESFLLEVGHPFTINASPELRAIAFRHGWPLFDKDQDFVPQVVKILGD